MHSQPCIFQSFLFIAGFPGSALAGRKLGADDAEGDQLQRNGHSQQDQRGEKAGAGTEDDLAQAGDDVADRRDGGHGDGLYISIFSFYRGFSGVSACGPQTWRG